MQGMQYHMPGMGFQGINGGSSMQAMMENMMGMGGMLNMARNAN